MEQKIADIYSKLYNICTKKIKEQISVNNHIELIMDIYPSLPKSQKKVADYIISNVDKVLYMSVLELKEIVGASEPTIFRFCKSLGFKGFRDFKIAMAEIKHLNDDYYVDLRDTVELPDAYSIINKVLMVEKECIDITRKNMDYKKLNTVAEMILNSNKICFCGMSNSGVVCMDAMTKFSRIGKAVWACTDFHFSVLTVSSFTKNDLIMGISHSGKTKETCKLMKIGRDNGAKTIGMTAYPDEKISQYSDIILKTYTRENPYLRVALASRVSQYAMIDALFLNVLHLTRPESLEILDETKSLMQNLD